jgi:hypothetical protein
MPNYERVAKLLVRIGLRRVLEQKRREGDRRADGRVLPGLDRRASDRGVLDRRSGGKATRLRFAE